MSWKRALALLLSATAIAAVAGVISVRHPATGAPAPATAATVRSFAAPVNQLQAKEPDTTLALSSTLHLIERTTATAKIGANKVAFTVLLAKKSGHTVGDAAYTCTISGGVYKCRTAFAFADGILLGSETANVSSGAVSGSITGGNGSYSGATGTMKGSRRSNGTVALTVTYSTG